MPTQVAKCGTAFCENSPDVYSSFVSSFELWLGESGAPTSSLASLPPLLESLEEGVEEEELSPAELMGL